MKHHFQKRIQKKLAPVKQMPVINNLHTYNPTHYFLKYASMLSAALCAEAIAITSESLRHRKHKEARRLFNSSPHNSSPLNLLKGGYFLNNKFNLAQQQIDGGCVEGGFG